MSETITTRFAPSPTGKLHVGNARTAILTWLFARSQNGKFILRLDDTDAERSTEEFAQAIQNDLTWLGVDWDDLKRQSDRWDRYNEVIQRLKDDGRLYACYETKEELDLKRKVLLQQKKPPIYDRAALNFNADDIAKYEAQGRKPHWRFKLDHKTIEWNDRVRGPVKFEGADMSDPVLIREDGRPLYHLCSVIDDIDFDVNFIVRGEDHVANSAFHTQIFEALGATPPHMAHLPLISDASGGKLSKRLGSLSLESLRENHFDPMAIMSLLGRLGTSQPIEPFQTIQPLIESFDFATFSRNTPKFDEEELKRLNTKLLHAMPYDKAKPFLKAIDMDEVDEPFWIAVRANLENIEDVKEWWRVANGPVEPVIEDPAFAEEAAALLPAEPWDENTFNAWTTAVKEKTERKGKALFMPLRQALTGMDHGPEMPVLLPLIGPEKTKRRLLKKSSAAA